MPNDIQQILKSAVEHHQAGQLDAAAQGYAQILASDPTHGDALHLAGCVRYQKNDRDAGIALVRQAIEVNPGLAVAHDNLGLMLRSLGDLAEAEASHRRAAAANPDHPDAHNHLGVALVRQNRVAEGIECYRRAIALKPDYAEAHNNLGSALLAQGNFDEAAESHRRAVAAKPDYVEAHNNLALALNKLGRGGEAAESLRRAIEVRPGYAAAHVNLGNLLREQGDLDAAIDWYRKAIAVEPELVDAHTGLAFALQQRGRLAEAAESYRRALELKPDHADALCNLGALLNGFERHEEAAESYRRVLTDRPDHVAAHCNMGVALMARNEIGGAVECYRRAIELSPEFADAHWNLSLARLVQGDFANGWRGYEWRLKTKRHAPRGFEQPVWDGGPLAGETILLHREQGLGDTIQFMRYAALVAARGGRVVLDVQPPLARLAAGIKGVAEIVVAGATLPQFDLHCPLLSLPDRFGTTLATIPAELPYLRPDPEAVEHWRLKLGHGPGLKVGIAWAGNRSHKNDRNRSVAVERLLPILEVPGIRWFSLQVGERAGDVARLPIGTVADLSCELGDFADTAAVIANLDLVIAVDTAVVHLAGALGRPVWAMLAFAPDWRWLLDREDSPWYPSVRLFRQARPGDWDSVLLQIRQALAQRLKQVLPEWRPDPGTPAGPPIIAVDPQLVFEAALAHHGAGRLDAADAAAKEAIACHPSHAGAHHLLGIIAIQRGDHQKAVEFLHQSITLDPTAEQAHNNLGIALAGLGRLDEAVASVRKATELNPGFAVAHYNLGSVLQRANRLQEAVDSLRRAIAANPDYLDAHFHLANALYQQKEFKGAVASYRRAVELKPDLPAAHFGLASALKTLQQNAEAETGFRRALELRPDWAEAHNSLGNALAAQSRDDEAIASFERALTLKPDYADVHNNLGVVLQKQNRIAGALLSYHRCELFRPDHADLHLNKALAYLVAGDFTNGWREYEWRYQSKARPPRKLPKPLWTGEDLAGKTILLHFEQGFGDTLQFIRYVPLLAARGARIVLEVQPPLARLAATIKDAAQVVAAGEALPPFDFHCPLLSLPERFGTDLASIPANLPYLAPEATAVARWRREIGEAPALKVGLVWAGNAKHQNERQRSLKLERLMVLFELPGIRWFSLQVGERTADLARLPAGTIVDLSRGLTDFAETAAAIANLDLVVAVDTSVVHLAGALGRPVWAMLAFAPDWRWLLGREDSPWYPSVRLFRQPRTGDWESVIARVRDALAIRAASVQADIGAQPVKDPAAEYQAAMAHYTAGRLNEVASAAQAILEHDPDHAGALHLAGIAELSCANHRGAAELLQRSIAIAPDSAPTHNNLGIALSSLGRKGDAIDSFRRAVTLDPNLADAHANLGRLLQDENRLDEAVLSLRLAAALKPDDATIIGKLGTALHAQGQLDEAAESFRRVLALDPNMAEADNYLGLICRARGRLPEAIEHYRRAIAYRPDFGGAHFNLGVAQLALGDFANGWREYEWRWQTNKGPLRKLPQPLWTGENLAGKTILLHHEQGLGATIQFMRYAPLVAALGARIVLELQPALVRLAAGFQGTMEVVAAGSPLAPFDFHCPLLSLPLRFATDLATIPVSVPYLVPEAAAAARWQRRLGPASGLKIGVVWAGNPAHHDDRNRSLPLDRLTPLFNVPGLVWFSLQIGERASDITRLPEGTITDLSRHLTDLAETAAAIANLDLVLAVDTAVVHLAGALGVPVWVPLPFAPDWRWMLGRDDSPWYPSVRLFRQNEPDDWDTVVARLRRALARRASSLAALDHDALPSARALA